MKRKPTKHRRWPWGYPTGMMIGRAEGFAWPSGHVRRAASMTRANRSFEKLGLSAPKYGARR